MSGASSDTTSQSATTGRRGRVRYTEAHSRQSASATRLRHRAESVWQQSQSFFSLRAEAGTALTMAFFTRNMHWWILTFVSIATIVFVLNSTSSSTTATLEFDNRPDRVKSTLGGDSRASIWTNNSAPTLFDVFLEAYTRTPFILGQAMEDTGLNLSSSPNKLFGITLARPRPGLPVAGLADYAWGGEHLFGYRHNSDLANVEKIRLKVRYLGAGRYTATLTSGKYRWVVRSSFGARWQVRELSGYLSTIAAYPGLDFHVDVGTTQQVADTYSKRLVVNRIKEGASVNPIVQMSLDINSEDSYTAIVAVLNVLRRYTDARRSVYRESADQTIVSLEEEIAKARQSVDALQSVYLDFLSANSVGDANNHVSAVYSRIYSLQSEILQARIRYRSLIEIHGHEHPETQIADAHIQILQDAVQTYLSNNENVSAVALYAQNYEAEMESFYRQLERMLEWRVVAQINRDQEDFDTAPITITTEKSGNATVVRTIIALVYAGLLMVAVYLGTFAWFFIAKTLNQPETIEVFGSRVLASLPLASLLKPGEFLRSDDATSVDRDQVRTPTREELALSVCTDRIRSVRIELDKHLATTHRVPDEAAPEKTHYGSLVAIVGTSQKTGKSFVSTLLAEAMALSDRKVLLIDTDVINGCIHDKYPNLALAPGLNEFLSYTSELEPERLIQTVVSPRNPDIRMDVITRGALSRLSQDRLGSARFATLLEYARANYEIAILDTLPLTIGSTAIAVASHADMVLFVARYGHSTVQDAWNSLKQLRERGVEPLGSVFNGVPLSRFQREISKDNYGYYIVASYGADAAG